MYSKEVYQYRKDNNLCTKCGKPIEQERIGRCLCSKCSAKAVEYATEYNKFAKSIGICPSCKRNRILGSESRCKECAARHAERNAKYRERNKERLALRNTERLKKLREERVEKGLCTNCGRTVNDSRYKTCQRCRNINAKYTVYKYEPKGRSEWKSKGMCYLCGDEPYENYKLCKKHYDLLTSYKDNEGIVEYRKKIKNEEKNRYISYMNRNRTDIRQDRILGLAK